MKKELLIPINQEIYYKSCYYNLLMSILLFFKVDPIYFYSNDLFYYEAQLNTNGFLIKYKNVLIEPEDIILKNQGIYYKSIKFEEIIKCIDNGLPVMLRIHREDWQSPLNISMFKKLNLAHNFIIYGYNTKDKYFKVLDSTPTDIIKDTIPFASVIKGIKDYSRLNKSQAPLRAFFKKNRLNPSAEKGNRFINLSKISKGLNEFKEIKQYYSNLNQESWNSISIPQYIIDIDKIKKYRKFELYRNKLLFPKRQEQFSEFIKIIDMYSIIQTLFLKSRARGKITSNTINSINELIQKIYQCECLYYDFLYIIFGEK